MIKFNCEQEFNAYEEEKDVCSGSYNGLEINPKCPTCPSYVDVVDSARGIKGPSLTYLLIGTEF